MAETAQFTDSTWPLLLVRMPPIMNVTAIASIIQGFERVLARKERFALVADCSPIVKFPAALERRMLTDWLGQEARIEKEKLYTVATGVVLTSGAMRAFVSALYWVRRPPTPQVFKATQGEAVEWCCDRIVEAGLPFTPALAALRAEHRRVQTGRPGRTGARQE
jgi:hypothetical protein